jgi:Rrf2 family protein
MAVHEEESHSADELHKKLDIPYQYLRQLLTTLSKFGFIESVRGRNGGFRFSRRLEQITLANIIDATEGLENYNKCFLGLKECPFENVCSMHDTWQSTRENILRIFNETTLADLVRK